MAQAYYPPAGGGGTDDQTASEVPYTPSNGAAWLDPDPTDVAGGLDKMAPLALGSYNILADTAAEATAGAVLTIDGPAGAASWGPLEVNLGTQSTGVIADSGGVADLDFALPSGCTRLLITEMVITRTAGTGTSVSASVFSDDARTLDEQVVLGSSFGGTTVNPGPLYGPRVGISADEVRMPIPYRNTDAEEFLRMEVINQDGINSATYDVTVRGIPLYA